MSTVDNIKSKDNYLFAKQFHWFIGVIEDVNDPEQRGRYRVRCFGYHTERKDFIPSTALPWATVMMPITSAAQSGVGESATGLLRGTWVVGFFRDGQTAQDPIIMGSLPSTTPTVDYDFGFCDPTEQYPYADKIDDQDIPEESISKDEVFRKSFSYLKKEEHRGLTPVPIAFSGDWELDPVDAVIKVEYPKNHVKAWERKTPIVLNDVEPIEGSGLLEETPELFQGSKGEEPEKEMHVQEFDVTPGWERISTMHCSGTYKEWTPSGDEHVVIVGDEKRVVVKNQHINVKGNCTLTVEGNLHTLVDGDHFVHIKGNRTELIEGMYTQTVQGNVMKTFMKNDIESIGMNYVHNVSMNKMLSNILFKTDFCGATSLETTIRDKNLITIGNNTCGVVGQMTTTVAQNMTEMVGMNFTGLVTQDRNEFVAMNSTELIGMEYLQASVSANHTLMATMNLSCAAGAVQADIGNPVVDNGHLPVLFP